MLTLQMIEQIHSKAKEKINLTYKKPKGSIGYCYLDPSKPLAYMRQHSNFPRMLEHKQKDDDIYSISVYKQVNNVQIFVPIADLTIHSKHKAMIMGILYGT